MIRKLKIEATINEEVREYIVNEDIDIIQEQIANSTPFITCTEPFVSIPTKFITSILEVVNEPVEEDESRDSRCS